MGLVSTTRMSGLLVGHERVAPDGAIKRLCGTAATAFISGFVLMRSMSTARDIMNTAVVHLEKDENVQKAAHIMAEKHVGSIIITTAGYPIGIVTETDIVKVMANGTNPSQVRVQDIMSSPLFSTTPDEDVLAVAATMSGSRIKKMPVMERQRVIGVITQTDIVHYALHAIQSIHQQYHEGRLSELEFSKRAAELFSTVPRLPDAVKHWHMRCQSCGFRFLADEEKGGKLSVSSCPRCEGAIAYDLSPPL